MIRRLCLYLLSWGGRRCYPIDFVPEPQRFAYPNLPYLLIQLRIYAPLTETYRSWTTRLMVELIASDGGTSYPQERKSLWKKVQDESQSILRIECQTREQRWLCHRRSPMSKRATLNRGPEGDPNGESIGRRNGKGAIARGSQLEAEYPYPSVW